MCKHNKTIETLLALHKTVAVAESCTGGLLSAAFVNYPGISPVFLEGVITYANEAKVRLGVQPDSLRKYGAVSREVAAEMAEAVRKRAGSTFGISTTGVAGPTGGTRQKPVGLVYIGIASPRKTRTYALRLSGDRTTVRKKTVHAAFCFLEKAIEG